MNRHQRRKRAKIKREQILEGLAQAERSRRIAATVRENLSKPKQRNYYPAVSSTAMVGVESVSHRGIMGNRLYDPNDAKRIARVKRS